MTTPHPSAPEHLPWFVTAPGATDVLYIITTILVVVSVILLGVLFFWLHSLPERMGHKKLQFEIVAVLGLISLFTHQHIFWIMGLLLALIDLPDLMSPLRRIADLSEKIAGIEPRCDHSKEKMNSLLYRLGREPRTCWRLILCSLLTILPDYLFRRFVQGKRFGHEITLFSVWYELRWGITLCLILTTLLITAIFYFHPATTSATSLFRGVPILPETNGRVSEIYVGVSGDIKKGQPIFKLDSTEQEAAVEVARRRITEIEAEVVMAEADILAAEGKVQQSQNALKQYEDELRTKLELVARNSGTVSPREIERLQTAVAGAQGQVAAAEAEKRLCRLAYRRFCRPRSQVRRPNFNRLRSNSTR